MAKKTKTYEIVGFNECKTSTVYLGVKVNMNFVGGNIVAKKNAILRTDNPFAQDAIENDERFKVGGIRLVKCIEEPGNAAAQPQRTEDKRSGETAAHREEQHTEEAQETVVEEVTNLNELDEWFAERGVTLQSSKRKDIMELCAQHRVSFPNLKLK